MIILIAGGTHSGKTVFAQKLLEKHHYPYLSMDHIKMGLIRGGLCPLTPESDDAELTRLLWPIAREIIKTAVENGQNLIIEGCYIPADYKKDFEADYLEHIRYVCLVFSERYIQNHHAEIKKHACDIERRMHDEVPPKKLLMKEHARNLELCEKHGLDHVLIDDVYEINWDPHS